MTDPDTPLVVLSVSPVRRVLAALSMGIFGAFLIWIALGLPDPDPLTRALLATAGLAMLWQGYRQYRVMGRSLILTRRRLTDSSGRILADLDQIASVDRGVFALKPTSGFVLHLKEPGPRAWAPGLWWRIGRRIGVGGATNGRAARDMADVIAILLVDPDAGREDAPGD